MKNAAPYKSAIHVNHLHAGLQLVKAEYSSYKFEPHFHDHYVLFNVSKGVNTGFCEKRKYVVTPGDLLMINPGEVHTGSSVDDRPLVYEALYIDTDFFDSLAASLNSPHPGEIYFARLISRDAHLLHLFQNTVSSFCLPDTLEFQSQQTIFFYALLSECSHNGFIKKDKKLYTEPVKKSLELIHLHFSNNFTLDELNLGTGISHFSFLRSFKKITGLTPFNYLRNYRVEMAKKMLKKNHNIVDVALELGFFDQSHFHRNFKKVTGITPGDYIRAFK
jgi:AraC-like DNA-binding protein